jgi:hypothetical protein
MRPLPQLRTLPNAIVRARASYFQGIIAWRGGRAKPMGMDDMDDMDDMD